MAPIFNFNLSFGVDKVGDNIIKKFKSTSGVAHIVSDDNRERPVQIKKLDSSLLSVFERKQPKAFASTKEDAPAVTIKKLDPALLSNFGQQPKSLVCAAAINNAQVNIKKIDFSLLAKFEQPKSFVDAVSLEKTRLLADKKAFARRLLALVKAQVKKIELLEGEIIMPPHYSCVTSL